jgi:hypothetical protein
MNKYIASLDVESIGLYGDPTAWALVIGDSEGTILAEYAAQLKDVHGQAKEHDPSSDSDRKWYRDHVDPATTGEAWGGMWQYEPNTFQHYDNIRTVGGLLDMFAREWEIAKQTWPGIELMADCPFPVETNFLRRATRAGEVYPLLDVNTLVYMHGNPNFPRLESELPVHNPLADARQSYRIWVELTQKANQP